MVLQLSVLDLGTCSRGHYHYYNLVTLYSDEKSLKKFWAVKDARVNLNSSNKTFLQHSSTHITRQEDQSYSATYVPRKDDHPPLPDSYDVCQKRTQSLVHRIEQMPGMLQTSDSILKEQFSR